MIEQEKMERHNRLRRKMAGEYEIRRAREMGLALPEGRCNRPRRSRIESPPSRCRRTSVHHIPENTVLFEEFETSSGTTPLFKGFEGTNIDPIELRKIIVDIHRNIPGRVTTNELKRNIPNKEDVVLKRRAGEGSKPLFDREEIKRATGEIDEVEHRFVGIVDSENSENELETLKRHSVSSSHTRTRNHSPRRRWSRHPRYHDSKHDDKESYRNFQPRPLMLQQWGLIPGPFGSHPLMMRRIAHTMPTICSDLKLSDCTDYVFGFLISYIN